MQTNLSFVQIFLCLVGLYAVFVEAAYFTCDFKGVTVGDPYVVSWVGDGTPVTMTLMRGPPGNIVPVRNITENNPANGTEADTFVWYPRPWNSATIWGHLLAITQSGHTNYSGRFFMDTVIAHKPQTLGPIILDPVNGVLGGGFSGISAGASSVGYTGSWHPAYMSSSSAPYPTINATAVKPRSRMTDAPSSSAKSTIVAPTSAASTASTGSAPLSPSRQQFQCCVLFEEAPLSGQTLNVKDISCGLAPSPTGEQAIQRRSVPNTAGVCGSSTALTWIIVYGSMMAGLL